METKTNDRAEFLKERLSGIGGTDASAIAGLNPYKTALDVYLEKRQLVDPPEENEAMYWGSALEPVVAERYAKETGSKLTRNNCLVVHPEYSFIIGHPDYLITNGNGQVCRGLEVKTAGFHSRHLWGEPGTDDVPKAYMIQVLHYSAILGVPFDLAVLIGGQDFAIYSIDPKPSMVKDLITIEKDFWENHILAGIAPAIDGTESSRRYLNSLYPADKGTEIKADLVIDKIANQLRRTEAQLKDAKDSQQLYQNQLKEIIGEASALVGPDWRITWKKTKDSKKIDWEAIAMDFWKIIVEGDYSAAEYFDVSVGARTTVKPGSRRFLTKWGENDNAENKEKK